jgi:hypothetical protein
MFMSKPCIEIHICNLKSPASCYSKIRVIDPYEKFVIGAEPISEAYICGINLRLPAFGNGSDFLSTESMLKCPYREQRAVPELSGGSETWVGDCDDCSHVEELNSPYCFYCSASTHSSFQPKK